MVPNYDKQDAVFHDLIVRTLARNPMGIETAMHGLEFNFQEVLKSVTIELENKASELREIKQAMYPFLLGYEIICPSCWLGFESPEPDCLCTPEQTSASSTGTPNIRPCSIGSFKPQELV